PRVREARDPAQQHAVGHRDDNTHQTDHVDQPALVQTEGQQRWDQIDEQAVMMMVREKPRHEDRGEGDGDQKEKLIVAVAQYLPDTFMLTREADSHMIQTTRNMRGSIFPKASLRPL